MSQRKRLKQPKVKGADRQAAREPEAKPDMEIPDLDDLSDDELLQRVEEEREQLSRQILDDAGRHGALLYALIVKLQALPQRRTRKRERLLAAAMRQQGRFRRQLKLWLDIYGEAPVPDSTPQWLAEDLQALREKIAAEKVRQAAAEESSRRFAEEVRPQYLIGDDDSFQEFAKRFIYE